jgi:hypothetical protein
LNLFKKGAGHNLLTVGTILTGANIMNEIFIVTRAAQALLALTIVSAIVLVLQVLMEA